MANEKTRNSLDTWYWEVLVQCPLDVEDMATYYLFESGALGIEEISRSSVQLVFKVYFSAKTSDPAASITKTVFASVLVPAGIEIVTVEKKQVENWQDSWKEHFKPLQIGKQLLVLPPWLSSDSSRKQIVIQPGFGFGTGYHESTNLALQLLEWVSKHHPYSVALDIGCGSGILSIAALKLSDCQVLAVDIDPDAVAEVAINLRLSGVKPSRCQVKTATPGELSGKTYDLVMANIEDHLLLPMSDDLVRLTRQGGILLLSGILTERKQELLVAFGEAVNTIKEESMNEWTAILLQIPMRQ